MFRYLAAVLIALNLLAPHLYAKEAATPIRTSIAKVKHVNCSRDGSAVTARIGTAGTS
jgi:hypothetical protein